MATKGKMSKQADLKTKEPDNMKEVLLSQMKESLAKEEKRKQKRLEERQKVEMLKEKNLLEQASFITSSKKKKNKTSKPMGTSQASTTVDSGLSDNFHSVHGRVNGTSDTWGSVSSSNSNGFSGIWEERTSHVQKQQQAPDYRRNNNNSGYGRQKYDTKKNRYKPSDENSQQKSNYSYQRPIDAIDAPPPNVNVWAQRETKREQIEHMRPHNEAEEEAMLMSVMELSKTQALEDQRRRQESQNRYLEQLKYMSENPNAVSFAVDPEATILPAAEDQSEWEKYENSHDTADRGDNIHLTNQYNQTARKNESSMNLDEDGVWGDVDQPTIAFVKQTAKMPNYEDECTLNKAKNDGIRGNSQRGLKPFQDNNQALKINKNIYAAVKTNHGNDDGVWGDVDQPTITCVKQSAKMPNYEAKCPWNKAKGDGIRGNLKPFQDNNKASSTKKDIYATVEKNQNNDYDDGVWGDVDQPSLTRVEEPNYEDEDEDDSKDNNDWDDEQEDESNHENENEPGNKCDWDNENKSEDNPCLDRDDTIIEDEQKLHSEDLDSTSSEKSPLDDAPEISEPYGRTFQRSNKLHEGFLDKERELPSSCGINAPSKQCKSDNFISKNVLNENFQVAESIYPHHNVSLDNNAEKSGFGDYNLPDAGNISLAVSEKIDDYCKPSTMRLEDENLTARALSLLRGESLKGTPVNVQEWLDTTQKEVHSSRHDGNTSMTGNDHIASAYATETSAKPQTFSEQFPVGNPLLNELNGNINVQTLPNSLSSSQMKDINVNTNSVPLPVFPQTYGLNHMFQPNPLMNPFPMFAPQQMMMGPNPLLMQQLYNLQMFYLTMGAPIPNAFPPYLPNGSQFPISNEPNLLGNISSNPNVENMNSAPSALVPPSNEDVPRQMVSLGEIQTNLNAAASRRISTPPGINTSHVQSQFTRDENNSIKFPLSSIELSSQDDCVPIPPPRPMRSSHQAEHLRQPRHRFNDLYPSQQFSTDSSRPN